ncbi:MAG: hypothetical protein HYV40_01835 [Candidatus Levybacteria bacterium]|nr:hypothetical protein [Candidatus Levybacteria bacterium]
MSSGKTPLDETSVSPNQLSTLVTILKSKNYQEKQNKRYASAKEILKKLAAGAILIGIFLAPKPGYLAVRTLMKNDKSLNEWKHFNISYLRQTLRRMAAQKLVRVETVGRKQRIVITELGKKRVFEYGLKEIVVPKKVVWDKKWRVIIYDIPKSKKALQEHMRRTLKQLGFLQLQKSTYLIPYPCYKEIEFLRSYYGLGEHLKYMLVSKLEDDPVYKTYFGLK